MHLLNYVQLYFYWLINFIRVINTASFFKLEQTSRNTTSTEQYVTVFFPPSMPGYGFKKKTNQNHKTSEG